MRKTDGILLAIMLVVALVLVMGPLYMNRERSYPVSLICDGPISGPHASDCAHWYATMTAEAQPPFWLGPGH